ncbi:NAD(P)-binding protein [Leucogyrophana mollusca]|uniref:NAD(P)-binding protein n=1 Tax=Leucogyrophana mollusca TaxID=85980 RepID=A0ACB8BP90_9AGAM|nr:NAD(P)-binding protein [Leucogyrophana mollusca]
MRAYVINEWIHPSKLTLLSDAPEPEARLDEVIVEIYSAALNFFDILQVQGKYQVKPPFPFVLGAEFAGKIAKDSPIPEGCPFRPGDRVFGSAQGSFADKVACKWKAVNPLPDNLTFDEGAGLYITWPTSYEALVGRAQLKPGESVLVNAAAGGVGIAAVQLAKALGAKVIAAAGSQAKLDICTKYGGADYTVNYTRPDWQKEVLKITGGKGVDVVYDPVGRIGDALKCIAFKGRALVIGFAAGAIEKLPLNLVLLKNVTVMGTHWGLYTSKEPERIPVVWDALLDLLASGRIKPVVYSKVYSLDEVASGLRALEKRETWGKAIVRVKNEDRKASAKL